MCLSAPWAADLSRAWLRQPTIIGYVLAGVVIGPFTPGPTVSEMHILELFAEIGVIFLMYSIGIEFSPKDLLAVKWVAVFGGLLGIVAIVGMGMGIGSLIGWPITQSIAVGAAISLASTMVLSRLLMDRGELHSTHGKAMIGITLVDDLAFVVMTILLPASYDHDRDKVLFDRSRLWQSALNPRPSGDYRGESCATLDGGGGANRKPGAVGFGGAGTRVCDGSRDTCFGFVAGAGCFSRRYDHQ